MVRDPSWLGTGESYLRYFGASAREWVGIGGFVPHGPDEA
jgi:hypothetical protein